MKETWKEQEEKIHSECFFHSSSEVTLSLSQYMIQNENKIITIYNRSYSFFAKILIQTQVLIGIKNGNNKNTTNVQSITIKQMSAFHRPA